MSIIQNIKSEQLKARKNKDELKKSVLTALYSEVSIVGKNKGNRETDDQEAIVVIKKFIKGVNETITIFKDRNKPVDNLELEVEVYQSFLPKQMNVDELGIVIDNIIKTLAEPINPRSIGVILKTLNVEYIGLFDGNLASKIVKDKIATLN